MRIFVIVIVLALSFTFMPSYGYSEVAIYAERTGGGQNVYETQYGKSGDWLLSCSEQVRGGAIGSRWCTLKPAGDRRFSDDHHEIARNGVSIELWRDASFPASGANRAVIDFTPINHTAPGAAYRITCGEYNVIGFSPRDGVRRKAYGGPQATAAISAIRSSKACEMTGSDGSASAISVEGFEEALAYASAFTSFDMNRSE
ncbi:MAG: hypothetical protein DHS20C05_02320 [Hyphococcus sp.]|nr:MAG: hypothetical protein DHS20C05_02320 [Marinicaulis sp.]